LFQEQIAVAYGHYGLETSQRRVNWKWIVAVFLGMRLLISGIGVFTLWHYDPPPPAWATPGHPVLQARDYVITSQTAAARLLLNGWYRWDTGWYLKVAIFGYDPQDGSVGYQPLYPFLIRLVASITGANYLLVALILSNTFALVALFLFHLLALQELGSANYAHQATIVLLAFPSAFFLFVGYTESLFLALTLTTWLLGRNNHWGWATVTAAFVVLARVQGLAMTIPLGWMYLTLGLPDRSQSPIQEIKTVLRSSLDLESWKRRIANWPTAGLAVIMPVMAYLGQSLYLKYSGLGSVSQAYGNWLEIVPPWIGVGWLWHKLFSINLGIPDWIDLFLLILFLILGIIGIYKIKPALSLYMWATLVLVLMRGNSFGLFPGFMRYMMTTFPVFLIFVLVFKNKWARSVTLFSFIFIQCILVWAYLNWFWIA
jgi:Gpi18-like mannosyltransferase